MVVLLNKFRNEPAVALAVLVGVLTAAVAAGSVLAVGGAVIVAVLAAASSLLASLAGGATVRAQVTPTTSVPNAGAVVSTTVVNSGGEAPVDPAAMADALALAVAAEQAERPEESGARPDDPDAEQAPSQV